MRELISVIVPAYGVETTLAQCLDSILRQTNQNFEIIVIDDGATDKTPAICDTYAEKDSRISVIHQQNRGLSAARNRGLDAAKGEYIAFVDSDDWLAPRFLEHLLALMQAYPVQLAGCNPCDVQTRDVTNSTQSEGTVYLANGTEAILQVITKSPTGRQHSWCSGYAWNKLFQKELIDRYQLRFDPTTGLVEDLEFSIAYAKHCTGAAFSSEALYYYYQNPQSILHQFSKGKAIRSSYLQCPKIYREFIDSCPPQWAELIEWNRAAAVMQYISILHHMLQTDQVDSNFAEEAQQYNRKYWKALWRSDWARASRLSSALLRWCPPLWRAIAARL